MADRQGCEFCEDQGPLVLRARCHMTAPLQVTLEGEVLVLRCYLPACRREVGRFHIAAPEALLAAAIAVVRDARDQGRDDCMDNLVAEQLVEQLREALDSVAGRHPATHVHSHSGPATPGKDT